MVATHPQPRSAICQMGMDAVDYMTDAQRISLAIYAAKQVTSIHCVSDLKRLQNLAKDTAFELSAKRLLDEVRHG